MNWQIWHNSNTRARRNQLMPVFDENKRRIPQTPRKDRPRCGAMTREGRPCAAPVVWDKLANRPRNGRCKLHGGLSTNPESSQSQARMPRGSCVSEYKVDGSKTGRYSRSISSWLKSIEHPPRSHHVLE